MSSNAEYKYVVVVSTCRHEKGRISCVTRECAKAAAADWCEQNPGENSARIHAYVTDGFFEFGMMTHIYAPDHYGRTVISYLG